ncbi:MAG: 23S rRNA (pseudouridine(1915)-N(3))-methyltransferase RlmH [candidate division Zixibacteria bacterium]|nr:23S rRNA (pseudouridine(1915)-N(3))-methyltransferase RlmH [candidate division Zixibacteria bacterium]
MLKITIAGIGKDKDRWVTEGAEHFHTLLSRYAAIDYAYLPALKGTASLSPDEVRAKEAERLLPAISKGYVIALTDRGKQFDSLKFARLLERIQVQAQGRLTFVIGGPHGLAPVVLEQADLQLSLSPLTFSHQVVRLVLLEQLFRAFDILKGGSYHK